jgi:hypothetical protein
MATTTERGTNECIHCGLECSEARPVCCDFETLDDGTSIDPVCVECCGPHYRSAGLGVGYYTRMDCDV